MRPGLAKSRHGNGPGDAELSGRQAEDFIQAGSLGIQGYRQHQPERFQSGQLATAGPFFFQTSSVFQCGHQSGVEPAGQQLQVRSWPGDPP
jgi:hypothetical protein